MDKPENTGPEQPLTQPGVNGAAITPHPSPPSAPAPEAEAAPAPETPPEMPLTPSQWLAQNGIYLAVIITGLVWLYRSYGWEGLPSAFLTIFGIGFIIFIHELGHFLVAKWCDVHVLTFSIGFGPAIPGCSFRRGETTYKLALLPLGGYVNMVGEGSDADESENYPRSFKNKTVGQRMAIISAGVIMNVILGAICFMFVYRAHGVERTRASVAFVDPGGAAWAEGVRSGWQIVEINGNDKPNFEDLKEAVTLSGKGKTVSFKFKDIEKDRIHEIKLEPRRGEGLSPVIGLASQYRLQLIGSEYKKLRSAPVLRDSAATAARVINLKPGDVVVSATDADNPQSMKPIENDPTKKTWDYADLAKRLRRLADKPVNLEVIRAGATEPEKVELTGVNFEFGDTIVGTSVPPSAGQEYDPLRIVELPRDKRVADAEQPDPFIFQKRMRALAAQPVVLQVKRTSGATAHVFVPPAYHLATGMRMTMGPIAAVRRDSPAEAAGVIGTTSGDEKPDVISAVQMRDQDGTILLNIGDPPENAPVKGPKFLPLDPVRLPAQLAKAASSKPGKKRVALTVVRTDPKTREKKSLVLPDALWDETFDDAVEIPGEISPLSIPQLGLAYGISSEIYSLDTRPGSPASEARRVVKEKDGVWSKVPDPLQSNDVLTRIRFWDMSPGKNGWSSWIELQTKPDDKNHVDYRWARVFEIIQAAERPMIQVEIRRASSKVEDPYELILTEDETWPTVDRGLLFSADKHLVRAENLWEALSYGTDDTLRFIRNIYQGLSRVITGQISTKTFGGPIEIVSTTFGLASDDLYKLVLFLGVLSINLAVVNFLPIPLLDGGHMVFLIYEKIRGKPASEQVRAIAAYIGLTLLLALMVYVFVLDIQRRILQ